MKIGESLKQIRKDAGKTQVQACKGMKISQTYLSQIESGDKEPSGEMFRKICKYYKVPHQVVAFKSVEKSDIPKNKLPIYVKLKPLIDDLTSEILNHK